MKFSEIQADPELETLQYVLLGGGLAVLVAALLVFFTVQRRVVVRTAVAAMAAGLLVMVSGAVTGQIGQDRTYAATDRQFREELLQTYGMTTDLSLSTLVSEADAYGRSPAVVTVNGAAAPAVFRFTGDVIAVEDVDGNPFEPLK